VTARRGRPHTKLFREERERPVWLLADLGAAMFFGTRRQLTSSVVVRAAALVAWSAVLAGDRVGALLAGSSSYRILPPRAREAGALPLLATLIDMQPTAPSSQPSDCMKDGVNRADAVSASGSMGDRVERFRDVGFRHGGGMGCTRWFIMTCACFGSPIRWKVKACLTDDSESDCRAFGVAGWLEQPARPGERNGVSGKQSWRSSPTA